MTIYTITLYALQTILSQCKIKEKLNYMTYNRYTISTFWSMYKAEKERYNEHILELVQRWKRKCLSIALLN